MNKILLSLTLIISFNSYAQSKTDNLSERANEINRNLPYDPYYSKQEIEDEYTTENNEFQVLSIPDENNELSNFIRRNLDPDILKKVDFSIIKSLPKYKNIPSKIYINTIRITFEIDKSNKPTNFMLNTGNKELDKEVILLFKKYPLEKLSIDDSFKGGKISIQLFARENNKTIIKASTFAVFDQAPMIEDCGKTKYSMGLSNYNCLDEKIYEYVLANTSIETISKQKLKGNITLRFRFSIDTNGKVIRVNSIAPNKIIKDEIDRVLQSFDQTIIPAKRNNKAKIAYCDNYAVIIIEDKK